MSRIHGSGVSGKQGAFGPLLPARHISARRIEPYPSHGSLGPFQVPTGY